MRIFFITGNKHKFMEASLVLSRHKIELVMVSNVRKVEIQASSLNIISRHAARTAYLFLRKPLIVEDAGLYINALKGFPGPYSSYVYRTIGCEGILKILAGQNNRKAYFESAVAAIVPPYEEVFVARVYGRIAGKPKGSQGFGFDPIFIPEGSTKTFADMEISEKNMYSHRARALEAFARWLRRMQPPSVGKIKNRRREDPEAGAR